MIKEAMVKINKFIIANKIDAPFLMQVHDELVFAFREDINPEFPEQIKKIMLDTANKYLEGVEMKASYKVEDTWTKD